LRRHPSPARSSAAGARAGENILQT
jgi:hypothetical protein